MWWPKKRGARESAIALADRARDAAQWERAAEFYNMALERNPHQPLIWVQYGHALKENGNLQQAEDAYRRAIADNPGVSDSHLQLGHALKMQRKRDAAEGAYLRAFALDPALSDPLNELRNLGWSEVQLQELRRSASTV